MLVFESLFLPFSFKASDLEIVVGIYNIDRTSVLDDKENKETHITDCKVIAFHPKYKSASGKYDVAVLHMKTTFKYKHWRKNTCPNELEETVPTFDSDDCLITGWGNSKFTFLTLF